VAASGDWVHLELLCWIELESLRSFIESLLPDILFDDTSSTQGSDTSPGSPPFSTPEARVVECMHGKSTSRKSNPRLTSGQWAGSTKGAAVKKTNRLLYSHDSRSSARNA
jgi:hypothetical protein